MTHQAPAPRAYYNEYDPKAAAWLRELIKQGHIAPGDVDDRSIVDVRPADLVGYAQCHFFAGIGVWSHALRRAGWPDARPIWTGSCPCQPFSAAGKGDGFDDERHLWPHFYWLIAQSRPPVVAGEQVASKDADPWIDLVQSDLEALGYAVGATPFPSAGVGAPHIRDRLYWVADARRELGERWQEAEGHIGATDARERREDSIHYQPRGLSSRLGDGNQPGLEGLRDRHQAEVGRFGAAGSVTTTGELGWLANDVVQQRSDGEPGLGNVDEARGRVEGATAPAGLCGDIGLADDAPSGRGEECSDTGGQSVGDRPEGQPAGLGTSRRNSRPGPTNGLWGDVDWLHCRDGKWRPVEPGTFPLAHGAAARVGRLRGYGNAINAEAATVFIEAYLESRGQ